MLTDPQQKARLEELGGTFVARSSVDFGQRLVADSEKWTTVIRTAQIKIQ
jgi:hypothetical protein